MINVINDFDSRVKEIDIYFAFLEELISNDAQLYFPKKKIKKHKKINKELTKILRANGFLLLYNLIESSVKKSIETIHTSLNNEQAKYKDVTKEIKKRWIKEHYKNFKKDEYVEEKIFLVINSIENDIISMTFDSKKTISGNIDSRKIKEFSEKIGFSSKTHHTTRDGEKLFLVKNNRNNLAHGIVSFCDCGKDYTMEQLIEIKKQVIAYLKNILKNVSTFINDKKYLLPVTV